MKDALPETWRDFLLASGMSPELWLGPLARTDARRKEKTVFPPEGKIFRAFALTPPEAVRIVLLGQDPYHDDGQAEGLAFSVPEDQPLPPSLRNIFREYAADLHRDPPDCGHLGAWAAKGVLLLNAVLSVDAHAPGSHAAFGWEKFIDGVISALDRRDEALVFILWGGFARKKSALIDRGKHTVIESAHPSPLSAHRGFFGSRPFSRAAAALPGWRW